MPYVDGLWLELVRECLANRVPVNQPDQAGNTPLHWAARSHICLAPKVVSVNIAIRNRELFVHCSEAGISKNYSATNSGSPEVELRFCPWIILFKY